MSTRHLRRQLNRDNASLPKTLVEIPPHEWPSLEGMKKPPIKVWRSSGFLVQIYAEQEGILRMSVCRTAINTDGTRWQEGITWDDLQRLKRECGFGAHDAVEIYPRDVDIVNVANMRHLWLLSEPLPFGWRKP